MTRDYKLFIHDIFEAIEDIEIFYRKGDGSN